MDSDEEENDMTFNDNNADEDDRPKTKARMTTVRRLQDSDVFSDEDDNESLMSDIENPPKPSFSSSSSSSSSLSSSSSPKPIPLSGNNKRKRDKDASSSSENDDDGDDEEKKEREPISRRKRQRLPKKKGVPIEHIKKADRIFKTYVTKDLKRKRIEPGSSSGSNNDDYDDDEDGIAIRAEKIPTYSIEEEEAEQKRIIRDYERSLKGEKGASTRREIAENEQWYRAKRARDGAKIHQHIDKNAEKLEKDLGVEIQDDWDSILEGINVALEDELKVLENLSKIRARSELAQDRLRDSGFNAGDQIMANIYKRLDGMGMTRSQIQQLFHRGFIRACLPLIYGDDWVFCAGRVMKSLKIDRIQAEVCCMTPRRFGKTEAVALFVAAFLLEVKGIRICIFSTGKRASSALMASIRKKIVACQGGSARIVKRTEEKLFISSVAIDKKHMTTEQKDLLSEGPDISQLFSYPGGTTSQYTNYKTHTHIHTICMHAFF